MIIKSFYNTDIREIEKRKWNPYLGISINKKIFTYEYILSFMNWATEIANQKTAIVIVDVIQSLNNIVLDRKTPINAFEKAFRKAEEVRNICEQARSNLDKGKKEKLIIIEWTDIIYDEIFRYNTRIFNEAYEKDGNFKERLINFTKANLGSIVERLNESEVEILSRYLLSELPEVMNGFLYDGIHFNLNVYPGNMTDMLKLIKEYIDKELSTKFKQIGDYAIIEAY